MRSSRSIRLVPVYDAAPEVIAFRIVRPGDSAGGGGGSTLPGGIVSPEATGGRDPAGTQVGAERIGPDPSGGARAGLGAGTIWASAPSPLTPTGSAGTRGRPEGRPSRSASPSPESAFHQSPSGLNHVRPAREIQRLERRRIRGRHVRRGDAEDGRLQIEDRLLR